MSNRIVFFFIAASFAAGCASKTKNPNEEVIRGKYTHLSGTTEVAIAQHVRRRTKELSSELKPCYDPKLAASPGAPLEVRMAWTINNAGQVVKPAAAEGSDPKFQDLSKCVSQRMDHWFFINDAVQDIEVVLPLSITQ